MRTMILAIEGMSCGSCIARVRRVLTRFDEVAVESITLGRALLRTAAPPGQDAAILLALAAAGYPARIEGQRS
jgi:copper chaperone CopZ